MKRNRRYLVARALLKMAKIVLANPHQLKPEDVIYLQGTYHNDTDDFDAVVSSSDSRKINNEARHDTRLKGIEEYIIREILEKLKDLFKSAEFQDSRPGKKKNDVYDRRRYVNQAEVEGDKYEVTFVLLFPNANNKDPQAKIKLHHLYISHADEKGEHLPQ